jgi:hypothetical protein
MRHLAFDLSQSKARESRRSPALARKMNAASDASRIEVLRHEWKRTLDDYFARKFDPNQPRAPAGSREGGR